jgi:preprotein translocase subunit Sec61beta
MIKKFDVVLYVLLMAFSLSNVSEENSFFVNTSYVLSAGLIFGLSGAKDIKLKPLSRILVSAGIFIVGVLIIPNIGI